MKRSAIFAGAGFLVLGGIGSAMAQPVSGTPDSPFPHAAPHEIRWINGVPCRTILNPNDRNTRIPIACAGPVAGVAGPMAPVADDVVATGSIVPGPVGPMMGSPVPMGVDPYAAPHEIRYINGVPCRTVYDRQSGGRIPVACAR